MGKIFNAVLKNRLTVEQKSYPSHNSVFEKTEELQIVSSSSMLLSNRQKYLRLIFSFVLKISVRLLTVYVDHSSLWKRLISLGISQQMLQILQSMYTKAASRIKVSGNQCTVAFPCQKGVRQGCTLAHYSSAYI